MPAHAPNSRIKDLPDIALLATAASASPGRERLERPSRDLNFRKTHAFRDAPDALRLADAICRDAREDQLVAHPRRRYEGCEAFLDPVLAGNLDAVWSPASWTWS